MRRLTVVGLLLLVASPAYADLVKWFPLPSRENKVQICLNTGMKLKAGRHDKWTMLGAKEGPVRIVLLTYKGAATFPEMQQAAVHLSKIPGNYWKVTRRSASWHGFGENATYVAQATDNIVIAFLGKHGTYIDRNYIMFVTTPKATFLANQKVFEAWGDCLKALP